LNTLIIEHFFPSFTIFPIKEILDAHFSPPRDGRREREKGKCNEMKFKSGLLLDRHSQARLAHPKLCRTVSTHNTFSSFSEKKRMSGIFFELKKKKINK
jgi:hypothetical protein